ncbi:glycoside hydrolase family 9 protein [Paraburkholderia sp. MMS20-SJTN17]|uniref:Endoglucanase n=1 Tax=Paraburkholderia translucens TaxID=2886945 RepID=A0ABS8KD64_9BURK|nr:glycoside hydrolase family 9 protein [Paraburkholderia sp. MMS20-SJTN17]MCC8402658.1 glycoside hydrolase family 9 protein [Paraburkholderia sp. MMS20-SJTN17]
MTLAVPTPRFSRNLAITVALLAHGLAHAASSPQLSASAHSLDKPADLVLTARSDAADRIAKIVFFDNGKLVSVAEHAPYVYTVKADTSLNGQHIYSAQVYDRDGHTAMSAPVSVTVDIAGDHSTAELLPNGDFAAGTQNWWTAGVGAQDWQIAHGESCIQIGNPGSHPWDVILGQGGKGLTRGETYTVSFSARSPEGVPITALLQKDGGDYTRYYAEDITDLGGESKRYSETFTMAQASDGKAAFQFQMGGKRAGTVCVSNVSVKGPKFDAGPIDDGRASVYVNQIGYLTGAPKLAMAQHDSLVPVAWRVLDAARHVVAQGTTRVDDFDPSSGLHLHTIDFSSLHTPGDGYTLEVDGRYSHAFRIGDDLYSRLRNDALSYFYQTRSGVSIEQRFVGNPLLARPAGHVNAGPNTGDANVTCFDKIDTQGNHWPSCGYRLSPVRGWYDAGDHGKYVVNGGIAVWTLMNQYEHAKRFSNVASYADGRLAIPENANGANDLLDEARWEMDFLMSMQVPDGQRLELPVGDQGAQLKHLTLTSVDASGMVHQALHDLAWTGLPTRPEADSQPRYVYYPTTAATLNMAATAAQCARVFKGVDDAYAGRCLRAAKSAWQAARRNPAIYAYPGLFNGGGAYEDNDVSDEFYWAAAELYATTGEQQYLDFLKASHLYLKAYKKTAEGELTWSDLTAAGTITLALEAGSLPDADRETARANLIATADAYLADIATQGFRLPMTQTAFPWGSNGNVANRALMMALAYDFTGERKYVYGALDSMGYLLGRNPMDKSYVSGYGTRALERPHHRFWAHALDAQLPNPPAGVLSGGPNSENMADPVSSGLKGNCAPETCYIDDNGAYAVNEVAINWNAPFAWVAAFVDDVASGRERAQGQR